MKQSTSEYTDFLKEKWINAFHFIDVNGDGVHTIEDYLAKAEFIINKTEANPEQAVKIRQEFAKWFEYLQPDPTIRVDLARYLATCKELYEDDNYNRLAADMARELFLHFDFNKDGKISPEELAIFYEAHGVTDRNHILAIFSKMDKNGDGLIELEEFVDVFVRYCTDPNPVTGAAYFMYSSRSGLPFPSDDGQQ